MRDLVAVLLYLVRVAVAAGAGIFGGWSLSKVLCEYALPGFVCGHNAFITVFFLVPLVGLLSWFLVSPITWAVQRGGRGPTSDHGA